MKTPAPRRRAGRWHPAIPREIEQRTWENGASVPELCEILGISQPVHYAWMRDHPSYARAVRAVRARHSDVIEAALIRRAEGYEYTAEEVVETEREVMTGDGEIVTLRDTRRHRKPVHVPPDVSAQRFFLTNRDPERWAEKATVEVTSPYAAMIETALRKLEQLDGRTLDGIAEVIDAEVIEEDAEVIEEDAEVIEEDAGDDEATP